MNNKFDVIIIGAGAAGLSAAGVLVARGKRVAVIDMGNAPARKVMASGGGRCNITNATANHTRYFGKNPNFVRGALSRVTPSDIISWATNHKIRLVEKNPGQYFCADGADVVVDALVHDAKNAHLVYNTKIDKIKKINNEFYVNQMRAKSVIVATGGISFPVMGVSDAGYKIAKQFGHKIIPVRPALCGLATDNPAPELAGISVQATVTIKKEKISDSLLFTHFGLGGPLAYRTSLHDISDGFYLNLVPNIDIMNVFKNAKQNIGRRTVTSVLAEYLPGRVAKYITENDTRNIADIKDAELKIIAKKVSEIYISREHFKYHDMQSAEVVRGGINTDEISSVTMESKLCPGVFFAGEVIDIAGDLGGFNLHWAWASGRIAGENA